MGEKAEDLPLLVRQNLSCINLRLLAAGKGRKDPSGRGIRVGSLFARRALKGPRRRTRRSEDSVPTTPRVTRTPDPGSEGPGPAPIAAPVREAS